jgi:hypothetical protein
MGISFNELLKKQKSAVKQPQSIAASHTEHPVASVQRMIGNAATVRLLQRENSGQEGDDEIINNNANTNDTDSGVESGADANSATQDNTSEEAGENAPRETFVEQMTRLYRSLKTALEDNNQDGAEQYIHALKRRGLGPASNNISAGGAVEGAFSSLFSKKKGSLKAYNLMMQSYKLKKKITDLVKDYADVPWAYQMFAANDFLPSGKTVNPFTKFRNISANTQPQEQNRSRYNNRR